MSAMIHLSQIAKPIPMKRELKPVNITPDSLVRNSIAKPIPMKRELKQDGYLLLTHTVPDCKAYPDEKGIETSHRPWRSEDRSDCKAYPDEKGIETLAYGPVLEILYSIAKPIPMKRELKRYVTYLPVPEAHCGLQSLSR